MRRKIYAMGLAAWLGVSVPAIAAEEEAAKDHELVGAGENAGGGNAAGAAQGQGSSCRVPDIDKAVTAINRTYGIDLNKVIEEGQGPYNAAKVNDYQYFVERLTTPLIAEVLSSPQTQFFLGGFGSSTDGFHGRNNKDILRGVYHLRKPDGTQVKVLVAFKADPKTGKLRFAGGKDSLRIWAGRENAPLVAMSYDTEADQDGNVLSLSPTDPTAKDAAAVTRPQNCLGCHGGNPPRIRSPDYQHYLGLEGLEDAPSYAEDWRGIFLNQLKDKDSPVRKMKAELEKSPEPPLWDYDFLIRQARHPRTFALKGMDDALKARCDWIESTKPKP